MHTVSYRSEIVSHEATFRRLLESLNYTLVAIDEAWAHVVEWGTFAECEAIEAEDLPVLTDRLAAVSGRVEADASKWPSWTDGDVWGTVEGFEPAPEDRLGLTSLDLGVVDDFPRDRADYTPPRPACGPARPVTYRDVSRVASV